MTPWKNENRNGDKLYATRKRYIVTQDPSRRMTKVTAPIAIALAVLAPIAGWEAMGPVMLYSVATPALISAGRDPASSSDRTPQKAIIEAAQGAFASGIDALKRNDVQAALNARDDLVPRDGIERKTLTYAIVTSGLSGVSSAEYLSAREELSGWPGLADLDRQFERALYRERPSDDAIFAAFRLRSPQTPEGNLLYARALKNVGEADRAKGIIAGLWATNALNTWLEGEVLSRFPDMLTPADHKARMAFLLYRDRVKQAARFAKLGNAQPLYDAWTAAIKQAPKTVQLLKAAETGFKGDSACSSPTSCRNSRQTISTVRLPFCRDCLHPRRIASIPTNGGMSSGSSAAACSNKASSRPPTILPPHMSRPLPLPWRMPSFTPAGMRLWG